MQVGSWNLSLVPDTPEHVRHQFKDGVRGNEIFRSFVLFFETDYIGAQGVVDQATIDHIADEALYCGPVWRRGNKMRSVGGPGLLGFMDNDRGSAFFSGSSETPAKPANVSHFVTEWFDGSGKNGLRFGGAASPNLGVTIDEMKRDTYLPPLKQPLDDIMLRTNNEYYVRAAARINWGAAQSLFQYPPKVLITEGLTSSVPYYTVLDVPIDGIAMNEDIDGFNDTSFVLSDDYDLDALTGSGYAQASSVLGPDVRSWPEGNPVSFARGYIRAASNDFSDVTGLAQAAADAYSFTNEVISVTANDACVLADIRPGDWVAISSPDDGLEDADHQIVAAGSFIHAAWRRAVAVHQPFNPGMGAVVCRYAPTLIANTWGITKLNDYIADESGPCVIEVGSRPRPTVPTRYQTYLD